MYSRTPTGGFLSRRSALALLASTAFVSTADRVHAAPAADGRGGKFGYEDVVSHARALAERTFDSEGLKIPDELTRLTYDSYREIRFRRDKALWRDGGSDFRLHPFHLGFLHDKPVQLHIIRDGSASPVPFTTSLFEYGKVTVPKQLSPSMGFAGFAVTTTLNNPSVQDELIAFLGASYFRLIGRGHRYGLSARSLALDVGGKQPEEFPFFRSLWLEEPVPDSVELVIYGLVDSPSVVGAFRYVVSPGKQTSMTVTATIIPRVPIPRIGIAPLTSMFLAGEGDTGQRTDFRPEIHDSDGLLLSTGTGEWVWRPIRNPKTLQISSFGDRNPRGFGLMQRDREFGHYQDLEAQYHARPGYWVEPIGDWGEGRVDLIEIPTDGEAFDNVVACWTSDKPLEPGKQAQFVYRISALSTTEALHPRGQVRSSFGALDTQDADKNGIGKQRFIVDFADGDLEHYLADLKRVELHTSVTAGTIIAKTVDPNPAIKGFRVMIDATLNAGETAHMRIALKLRAKTLTETWTSSWSVAAAPIRTPGPDSISKN